MTKPLVALKLSGTWIETVLAKTRLTRAELFVPYACGVMDTNWYPRTLGSHIFYVGEVNWLKSIVTSQRHV